MSSLLEPCSISLTLDISSFDRSGWDCSWLGQFNLRDAKELIFIKQTASQSQPMLKVAGGSGQRTQAIYLRKHNKRPEGPLKVWWQFLANTTKAKQSISLLTLTLPVTTRLSPADLYQVPRQKTLTSVRPDLRSGAFSTQTRKLIIAILTARSLIFPLSL